MNSKIISILLNILIFSFECESGKQSKEESTRLSPYPHSRFPASSISPFSSFSPLSSFSSSSADLLRNVKYRYEDWEPWNSPPVILDHLKKKEMPKAYIQILQASMAIEKGEERGRKSITSLIHWLSLLAPQEKYFQMNLDKGEIQFIGKEKEKRYFQKLYPVKNYSIEMSFPVVAVHREKEELDLRVQVKMEIVIKDLQREGIEDIAILEVKAIHGVLRKEAEKELKNIFLNTMKNHLMLGVRYLFKRRERRENQRQFIYSLILFRIERQEEEREEEENAFIDSVHNNSKIGNIKNKYSLRCVFDEDYKYDNWLPWKNSIDYRKNYIKGLKNVYSGCNGYLQILQHIAAPDLFALESENLSFFIKTINEAFATMPYRVHVQRLERDISVTSFVRNGSFVIKLGIILREGRARDRRRGERGEKGGEGAWSGETTGKTEENDGEEEGEDWNAVKPFNPFYLHVIVELEVLCIFDGDLNVQIKKVDRIHGRHPSKEYSDIEKAKLTKRITSQLSKPKAFKTFIYDIAKLKTKVKNIREGNNPLSSYSSSNPSFSSSLSSSSSISSSSTGNGNFVTTYDCNDWNPERGGRSPEEYLEILKERTDAPQAYIDILRRSFKNSVPNHLSPSDDILIEIINQTFCQHEECSIGFDSSLMSVVCSEVKFKGDKKNILLFEIDMTAELVTRSTPLSYDISIEFVIENESKGVRDIRLATVSQEGNRKDTLSNRLFQKLRNKRNKMLMELLIYYKISNS